MSAARKKSRKKSSKLAASPALSPGKALDECVAAISLVEVVVNSLDGQEIAACEQVALKGAITALWVTHDFIDQLADEHGDDDDNDLARSM